MRKWNLFFFLTVFLIITMVSSCDNNHENNNQECNNSGDSGETGGNNTDNSYPKLTMVNLHAISSVVSVSIVGYEFRSLNIARGNNQTFSLMQGMPGGYTDINITVGFRSHPASSVLYVSRNINFFNGKTTTVTLRGGEGEGGQYIIPQLIVSY